MIPYLTGVLGIPSQILPRVDGRVRRQFERFESEPDETMIENNISRQERLKRRLNMVEEAADQRPLPKKYKPSPEKKIIKDNRGQWRRLRRMDAARTEIERDSWRLFDFEDVKNHSKYDERRLSRDADWAATKYDLDAMQADEDAEDEIEGQPMTPQTYEIDNPVERHNRLLNGNVEPRFYERKFKHPSPIKSIRTESNYEDDSEEEINALEGEEEANECDKNELTGAECKLAQWSISSKKSAKSFESSPYNYSSLKIAKRRQNQRFNTKQKVNRKIKETISNKSSSSKIKFKKQLAVKAKAPSKRGIIYNQTRRTHISQFKHQNMKSTPYTEIATSEQRIYPKRKPCKIIDFDFDNQGKKIIQEQLSNYHNLLKMPAKKVAARSNSRTEQSKEKKPAASRSRSVAPTKPSKLAPKITIQKKNSKNTKVASSAKDSRSKPIPVKSQRAVLKSIGKKIDNKSKDKTPKRQRQNKNSSASVSPAKHGLAHLFDIHHKKLKPHTKKEKALRSDEFTAVRKIAEQTDRIEQRKRFGFKMGPAPKVAKRERSREQEKYVRGQPIEHKTMSFGNLGWFNYEQN